MKVVLDDGSKASGPLPVARLPANGENSSQLLKFAGGLGLSVAFVFGAYTTWLAPRSEVCMRAAKLAAVVVREAPDARGDSPGRIAMRLLQRTDLAQMFGSESDVGITASEFVGIMDTKSQAETWTDQASRVHDLLGASAAGLSETCQASKWLPSR